MKLATEIPWMSRRFEIPIERIKLTEQLGFDAVFTAEGTGSDALTPLGYVAAVTAGSSSARTLHP
jgi:alkanesulfonate monooxygenase SsuD/methylene tetrahydromethanopterin reductase-like flavin-dependent oxidoreductase (luciferase family)